MSKPVIFISHSTGKLPAGNDANRVLEALRTGLPNKGWDVFLDYKSVNPGDRWRDDILHNLATAQAGVVLINKEAGESTWVKDESLIMCFRKSIDPRFLLLFIAFPDANLDQTFLKTHEPFQFNEIQRVSFLAGNAPADFVRQILEKPELDAAGYGQPEECAWVEKVSALISGVDHGVLELAATQLALELDPAFIAAATASQQSDRLRFSLARLMHYKQAHDSLNALPHLMGALQEENVNRLKPNFLGKWVENESAESLFHSIRNPKTHGLLTLNAPGQAFADRYTDRIRSEVPARGPIPYVLSVALPRGDCDPKLLIPRFEEALRQKLLPTPLYDENGNELPLEEAVAQQLKQLNSSALCVLPAPYAKKDLLDELRRRFAGISFVVLATKPDERAACAAAGARTLNPPLTPDKLNQFSTLLARWNNLYDQFFPQTQTAIT